MIRVYLLTAAVFTGAVLVLWGLAENHQLLRDQGLSASLAPTLLVALLFSTGYFMLSRKPELLQYSLRQKQRELERASRYDPVTGLCNRRHFHQQLVDELARCNDEQPVGLLYLDLDRFKLVNDSLGYECGDEMLQVVAGILRGTVRGSDCVGRIGADEFCVLLREIGGPRDAAIVAEKLLAQLQQSIRLGGQKVRISASIGIACAPADAEHSADLIRCADIAMVAAKQRGRNTYEFFDPSMNEQAKAKIKLENELRQALNGNSLALHFQPLVSIPQGRTVAVEVLVRWHHPHHGLVSPAEFIGIAEESDLILDIGRWILDQACAKGLALQQAAGYPLRIAVNLSTRQLREPGLVNQVHQALERTGLAPELLELEITESMLMEDMPQCIKILHGLKRLGVRISIDDFGTGYSSLSQLKHLPVDTLKVDRSFVSDIHTDSSDRDITNAVIAMAHTLHLEVIAEGVENAEQFAILEQNHCDIAQGYWLSRPLPLPELNTLLRESGGLLGQRAELATA